MIDSVEFKEYSYKVLKYDKKEEDINELRNIILERFDVEDITLQDAMIDYSFIQSLNYLSDDDKEYREKEINNAITKNLMGRELLYAKAKNQTSSKDFWEDYFAQNPRKRPSKIVYYEGGDPTAALYRWRKDNGIVKKSEEEDFGFSENKKEDEAMNATSEQKRFMSIAEKLIDKRFPINSEWDSDGDEPPLLE